MVMAWYLLFGFVHELSHLLAAAMYYCHGVIEGDTNNSVGTNQHLVCLDCHGGGGGGCGINHEESCSGDGGIWTRINWIPLLFFRQFHLRVPKIINAVPSYSLLSNHPILIYDQEETKYEEFQDWIRHVGWMTSVIIALFILVARIIFTYWNHTTTHLYSSNRTTTLTVSLSCSIPTSTNITKATTTNVTSLQTASLPVASVATSASSLAASIYSLLFPPINSYMDWCTLAAVVTAIDAIWTDYFRYKPFFSPTQSTIGQDDDSGDDGGMIFYCGNFGLILLHSAWLYHHTHESKSHQEEDNVPTSTPSNNPTSSSPSVSTKLVSSLPPALSILQKMISITMMRGAQSGGIVTFCKDGTTTTTAAASRKVKGKGKGGKHEKKKEWYKDLELTSIRSRVVKSKRGDLSQLLIHKLQKDASSLFRPRPSPSIPITTTTSTPTPTSKHLPIDESIKSVNSLGSIGNSVRRMKRKITNLAMEEELMELDASSFSLEDDDLGSTSAAVANPIGGDGIDSTTTIIPRDCTTNDHHHPFDISSIKSINPTSTTPTITDSTTMDNDVTFFAGHTRFATSSKANLDGTHPHQWSPPTSRRMYNFYHTSCALKPQPTLRNQSGIDNVVKGHRPLSPKTIKHHSPNMSQFKYDDVNDGDDLSSNQRSNTHRCYRPKFTPDIPYEIKVEQYITHNGDFEFYELNGHSYDVDRIQEWLGFATGVQPGGGKGSVIVDSLAIAGMVDLLRCQGSFGLACRYVLCLGLSTSTMALPTVITSTTTSSSANEALFFSQKYYNALGIEFEHALTEFQKMFPISLRDIEEDESHRNSLAQYAAERICALGEGSRRDTSLCKILSRHVLMIDGDGSHNDGNNSSNEDGDRSSPFLFARKTVDAFFDNDLLQTVKIFMEHASGSFGLCVMSSLDAQEQICLAARGQSMSIAFYPQQQFICYGSEQAAVKAGMLYASQSTSVGVDSSSLSSRAHGKRDQSHHLDIDTDVQRLDLNDVNGEICLIDWSGKKEQSLSRPNRHINPHLVMSNKVSLYLKESSSSIQPQFLYQRMTKLTNNPLISPLKQDSDDPILQDLQDIPQVCRNIQENWRNVDRNPMFSLNRLTAVNLGRCLKQRLERYAIGDIHRSSGKIDILLTGCEVSLWLAEQFASDLAKAFPNLCIHAISSNKLLGLFGQEEINVPSVGFPFMHNMQFDDTIMIIVSHSGGTFAPLSCSSLFQSMTKNIFVVTSEWDTQVGRQLRSMSQRGEGHEVFFNSHIFTTGVGVRTAEPCSISVVATHQLLTNIFQYVSAVILDNEKYRLLTGATITEKDLQVLEKCNRDNLFALEEIVGVKRGVHYSVSKKEQELRATGDVWAEHILENAKAYIMSFVYVFATVISGFPLIFGIASLCGLQGDSKFLYLVRLLDAAIYFFLPQINIIILRLLQRRALLHRMVGRTVVIGDIPWVAQAGEAFLSKIFACSYSIAGLNVHSANPSDHLVHRMTHRVVRGTLLIAGRPDGRLSALTAAENAVCLSLNQASSIQSLTSTCETVTIGHNQFKLPLSSRAIFLNRFRPLFLCEYLLASKDGHGIKPQNSLPIGSSSHHQRSIGDYYHQVGALPSTSITQTAETLMIDSIGKSIPFTPDRKPRERTPHRKIPRERTSAALLGMYKSIEKETVEKLQHDHFLDRSEKLSMKIVVSTAIQEKKWLTHARRLFECLDENHDGKLQRKEFVDGLLRMGCGKTKDELSSLFHLFEYEGSGHIFFDQFFNLMSMHKIDVDVLLQPSIRDSRGLIQVNASREEFFGEMLLENNSSRSESISIGAMKSQYLSQELYESRIASMQRFVAMTIIFHQMGFRVQNFFSKVSFGFLGYRMDRSHSIMRIATTASPISGAEIRERQKILMYVKKVRRSIDIISAAWLDYKTRKEVILSLKPNAIQKSIKAEE